MKEFEVSLHVKFKFWLSDSASTIKPDLQVVEYETERKRAMEHAQKFADELSENLRISEPPTFTVQEVEQ